MAREERTSTAVSSQSPLNKDAKLIPPEVHNQLSSQFVPAVKEAALAGAELLRNYQALEKSSENYARCLESLARSSKTADLKAQEYGKELFEAVQDYKKYVGYHKSCIKELTTVVTKTTVYSNDEKEKLKNTFHTFQKEEKEILKGLKKGTKKQSDIDAFYETNAREFLRQQELRYKFFLDKHKRWFAKYSELFNRVQTERGVVPNGHAVVEQKPAEVIAHPEVPAIEEAVVVNGTHEEAPKVEDVQPAMVPPPVVEQPHVNGIKDDDPPFLRSGNSSPRSSISSMDDKLPSRRPSHENIPGVTLLHNERREHKRNSTLQEYKFDEATHVAPTPAPQVTSTGTQADAPPVVVQAYQPAPAQRSDPIAPARNSVVEQPQPRKFDYRGPIIMPAPVPRTREPEIIKQRETPMMVPRTVDAPVYAQAQPQQPQRYAAPPQERPHYHVESDYNPSVSPAHRPVSQNFAKPTQEQLVVPAMFNASDYGRTLTVTQDFNATSGEQITVNRGDRVILIKSGSRGWIFIQDQASQRTGWVPAPFVSY